MTTLRATILSALLLVLTGCVAYEPYPAYSYPSYGGPVVVAPPVYVGPSVRVYPRYHHGGPRYHRGWGERRGHGYGYGHGRRH